MKEGMEKGMAKGMEKGMEKVEQKASMRPTQKQHNDCWHGLSAIGFQRTQCTFGKIIKNLSNT